MVPGIFSALTAAKKIFVV